MKKFAVFVAMALLLPLTACAQAPMKWQEGTHYLVLDEAKSPTPQITEFFSFWCGHCFSFEPLVKQIKAAKGDDVAFNKVHVNFMGSTSAEVQDLATQAMMVGRALGQEDAINGSIFNYIHVQRAPITNLNDLRNIFIAKGIDGAEFDKLSSSFGIKRQVKDNQATIDAYRSYVSGVPNFIVNGKYQAKFTRDMTPDDMIELIVWLTKL